MSLSAGEAKIGDLRADNFDTWIEKVKDYIFALDHDDAVGIWTAYMWQAPEPGAAAQVQEVRVASTAVVSHRKMA